MIPAKTPRYSIRHKYSNKLLHESNNPALVKAIVSLFTWHKVPVVWTERLMDGTTATCARITEA